MFIGIIFYLVILIMNNFQDRYIRSDPRRNAKMSPIMWDDNTSRHFTYLEGFTGNVEGTPHSEKILKHTQVKCKNGKAEVMVNDNGNISQKMYDISPSAIMDNKILGNIEEIDKIHNGHVQNSMSFDRMMLNHFQNTTGRLHTTINPLVLSYHNRTLENDPFFNPKKN
jgi:hypothetical protein